MLIKRNEIYLLGTSTNSPFKEVSVPPLKAQLKLPDKLVEVLAVIFTTPDFEVYVFELLT